MNAQEHKEYLKEFSELTKKILKSEKDVSDFLVNAKINTPSGRLTKIYSNKSNPIGYRIPKKK